MKNLNRKNELITKNETFLVESFFWNTKDIIESDKTPYEKKIALFRLLKDLDVGDTSFEEKKRVNYLLQAHLYSDLAKQSMKEYKKITAEEFSKFK